MHLEHGLDLIMSKKLSETIPNIHDPFETAQ